MSVLGEPTYEKRPDVGLEFMQIPEREPEYEKVVLGHPFSSVDRDQILGAYFAYKAGVVPKDASVEFLRTVKDSDLQDSTVLVLEGFDSHLEGTNRNQTGNFHNNPDNDLPAASNFYNGFRRDLGSTENFDENAVRALKELDNWLKSVERGKPYNPGRKPYLSSNDLNVLTETFEAIKLKAVDSSLSPKEYLARCFEELDHLVTTGEEANLTDRNSELLEDFREYKEEKYKELERLSRSDQHLQTFKTATGKQITFFDVSQSGVDFGAYAPAVGRTKELAGKEPDLVVLFNDEKDEQGKILGKKIIIRGELEQALPDLLGDRLDYLESVFGKGFRLVESKSYGGHKGLIASAQFEGSGLPQEVIKFSLQEFFSSERYTQAEFTSKAKEFAQSCGVETFYPKLWKTPDNRWNLPERSAELVLAEKETGNDVKVEITESDLPLYEELFKTLKDNSSRQDILLQKSPFSEAPEIALIREKKNLNELNQYIEQENTLQALSVLNELNVASIKSLPLETRLKLIKMISADSEAISKVWDINDTQYGITTPNIPDYLMDPKNITEYQAARHNFISLPKKVDTYLIQSLISEVSGNENFRNQQTLIESLLQIADSEVYKKSHQDIFSDQLIQSILEFCRDEGTNEDLSGQAAKALIKVYGSDSRAHWEHITNYNLGLVLELMEEHSDLEHFLLEGLEIEINRGEGTIVGVPRSNVRLPDFEKIRERLKIQQESAENSDSAINLGLAVARTNGFNTFFQEGVLTEFGGIAKPAELDASIEVQGFIDLKTKEGESDHSTLITSRLAQIVSDVAKEFKENEIRIVVGGAPGQIRQDIASQIYQKVLDQALEEGNNAQEIKEKMKVLDKLVIASFDASSRRFIDVPLRRN